MMPLFGRVFFCSTNPSDIGIARQAWGSCHPPKFFLVDRALIPTLLVAQHSLTKSSLYAYPTTVQLGMLISDAGLPVN